MRNLLFVLSVDTEEEWDWDGPFPNRVISVDNVRHLPAFQDHANQLGLSTTYFLDYAVMENAHSREVLRDLYHNHSNIEYGAHLHPWVTPPKVPVSSEADSHIVNLPIETVAEQLAFLTSAVKELTGRQPTAFRSGRWGISDPILEALVEQGYQVDSSIYPFYENEWFSCARYDSWPMALPQQTMGGPLIELPVTAGFNHQSFANAQRLHEVLEQSPWDNFRLIGILWALRLHRKIYLSPELSTASDMIALCKQMLRQEYPVIHMYLHSSSLLPGSTKYVRSDQDKARLLRRIDKVVTYLRSHCHIHPMTITEAALWLRDEGVLKPDG